MDKVKKILQRDIVKDILILCVASMFICLPLLSNKLNIMYDDGIQHIARLIGTYQSIQEGQTFPVIMSKFCNGFGYSWNLFYSPLTAYLPLMFKLIGLSFIGCMKLFMFLVVFVSGIAMYFFVKEVTKNNKIALLAGIFYIFAPYRLTDMYARNALAELTSFIFLPMIFHGLYGVLKQKPKREYFLIFGAVGLILTHTVITMYVAIICFFYLITQVKKLKNRKIVKKLIVSLVFILLITSFFYIPLLEHKLLADYEVFKEGRMERTDVLIAFKLNFMDLFITPKENIMTYEIGFLSVILLVLSPIVIKKLKLKCKNTDFYRFYIFSLIAGLVSVLMTLKVFPFEKLPAILKMLQFSFRMLEFSSFFFAFVVAVNFGVLVKKVKYRDVIVILIVLMLLTTLFIPHLQFKDNIDENRLIETVPVTQQTGRVHAGCASFEYLPCKAFENRSYIETRVDGVAVLEGNAQIDEQVKQNTNFSCVVYGVAEETKIELPYIYYLGYVVTLKKDGQIVKLDTFETENGFVGVSLPALEDANLEVTYEGTFLMRISAVFSVLGLILLLTRIATGRFKKNIL